MKLPLLQLYVSMSFACSSPTWCVDLGQPVFLVTVGAQGSLLSSCCCLGSSQFFCPPALLEWHQMSGSKGIFLNDELYSNIPGDTDFNNKSVSSWQAFFLFVCISHNLQSKFTDQNVSEKQEFLMKTEELWSWIFELCLHYV